MKHHIDTWMIAIAAAFLFSCEKVVDVQLNDKDAKYVIEGMVTDVDDTVRVEITQTGNFSGPNNFKAVSGATVLVSDGEEEVQLTENAAGVYEGELKGVPGRTYRLEVHIGGEVFTASSAMPEPVPVEQVYISRHDMMGDNSRQVNIVFDDPVNEVNNYRFVQFINGVKSNNFYTRNDELTSGRKTTVTLFNHDSEIKPGDLVRVDMHSIDESMYKYWFSLNQSSTGETNSASPANPVTNLSGGALGYFSAHAITEKSITVPAE